MTFSATIGDVPELFITDDHDQQVMRVPDDGLIFSRGETGEYQVGEDRADAMLMELGYTRTGDWALSSSPSSDGNVWARCRVRLTNQPNKDPTVTVTLSAAEVRVIVRALQCEVELWRQKTGDHAWMAALTREDGRALIQAGQESTAFLMRLVLEAGMAGLHNLASPAGALLAPNLVPGRFHEQGSSRREGGRGGLDPAVFGEDGAEDTEDEDMAGRAHP